MRSGRSNGRDFECSRPISTVTVGNKDWLIETAVRWRQPSNVDESCLFQKALQLTPKHCTIRRGEMECLPRRFRVSRDVQVEAIAPLIQPIPDLKNNAPATVIRIEARSMGCRSFYNQSIVVADAANERAPWPKLPICLLSRLQQIFIGLQVRKGVVDTNHRVKARFRDCGQLHHVRDREGNVSPVSRLPSGLVRPLPCLCRNL